MCGFVGVATPGINSLLKTQVLNAAKSIRHRGPDSTGFHMDRDLAIAACRLKIIDKSNLGNQPFESYDKRYLVAFNGEIYNHNEIRRKYLSNYSFNTSTDTETLVNFFNEFDLRKIEELDGIFSIAVYDQIDKRLYLIRDRLGVKPLFIATKNNCIYFASEQKALKCFDDIKFALNTETVSELFGYGYVSGTQTLIKGIKRFPAGQCWEIDLKKMKVTSRKKYTNIFTNQVKAGPINNESCENNLGEAIKKAICSQLHADYPMGLCLSGGIDSGLIATYVGKVKAGFPAFHVNFLGGEFKEKKYAQKIAKINNMDLDIINISPKDINDSFEAALKCRDEPFHFPQAIGQYILCRKAQKKIKVLLCGDGVDELFGGYNRYLRIKQISEQRRSEYFDDKQRFGFLAFPAKQPTKGWEKIIKCPNNAVRKHVALLERNMSRFELVDAFRRLELITYLESKLRSLDMISMGNAIEARVPFLSNTIIDFALRMSFDDIIQNEPKEIIRNISKCVLPKEIIQRPKVGFDPPLGKWITAMKGRFDCFYDTECMRNIYDIKKVRIIIDKYFYSHDKIPDYLMWMLLNFEYWCRLNGI